MNVIFTVLFALPIGYFLKNRGIAIVTYLALDAIVFSYQSVGVLLDWMADNPPVAFGPSPTSFPVEYSNSELWGYGLVNLVIIAVGSGLVVLGARLSARRAAKRTAVAVA
ncbi:conserved hypothetical protein [Phycicoccus elongatus Lp2]|uniref:Integral membrane protein n=1 Tax=Phycicoccus elongatus Lp2 TaxID=1193181 RepID=N0E375_9MICO|nr:hypothetical protein [Phycicoccus elongatus]MBK8728126.1 hypothetical protein [Tetrasphaera sp.]CCH71327.1 conserved hypothetical protein [Phycicoccus elongatus Lp2]